MKKIGLSVTIILSLFLSACADSNVIKIQELPLDQSNIGKIFENWSDCENGEWKVLESKYKDEKIISYSCDRRNSEELFEKAEDLLTERERDELTSPSIELQKFYIEFMIRKDQSISIQKMGEKIIFSDGMFSFLPAVRKRNNKIYSYSKDRKSRQILKRISRNKYNYYTDKMLKTLDNRSAYKYLYNMDMIYLMAEK